MKSVRIRSFSGLCFPAFALNTDQKILEYGLIFYYFQVVHVFDSHFFLFLLTVITTEKQRVIAED